MSIIETELGRYSFPNDDEYIAQVVKAEGSWELDVCHSLFDALGAKRHGFDIGANVGLFSIQSAIIGQRTGRPITIDAFEVQPDTFATLQENIALNDLGGSITAHNKAVGAAQGTMEYDILDGSEASATGGLFSGAGRGGAFQSRNAHAWTRRL